MKCIICGCEETNDLKIKNESLIKCPQCGIIYCANNKDINNLDEYYRNNYVIKEGDKLDVDIRRLSALPEQMFLLSTISKYKPAPANFLDFGCDKGFLIEEARRFGYNVVGIELSESSTEYCRMNGLTIYDNLRLLNSKVDIVTMNHSLEHLVEPVEFLQSIKEYMNEEAIISIRVPDIGSFWSRILKSRWIWFQPQNHYFHYTINSLSYLLEHNGFEIILVKSRRPQNCKTNQAKRLSNSVYRKYFNQTISLRRKLAYYYSWITGVEVFAIARKKASEN
ncbi:MAG: class I SAM-dependent methyltransferase [bacterium]